MSSNSSNIIIIEIIIIIISSSSNVSTIIFDFIYQYILISLYVFVDIYICFYL